MIGAFRLLERDERRRVLGLPRQPPPQRLGRGLLRLAGAFDAEEVAGALAHRVREPPAVALRGNNAVPDVADRNDHRSPNREGRTASSIGCVVPSSIASATSLAVSGASRTPLR